MQQRRIVILTHPREANRAPSDIYYFQPATGLLARSFKQLAITIAQQSQLGRETQAQPTTRSASNKPRPPLQQKCSEPSTEIDSSQAVNSKYYARIVVSIFDVVAA